MLSGEMLQFFLRCIKTWLRSRTNQALLIRCTTLHAHQTDLLPIVKDDTDSLCPLHILPMNLLASQNGSRINILRQMNDLFPLNLNYTPKKKWGWGFSPQSHPLSTLASMTNTAIGKLFCSRLLRLARLVPLLAPTG